MTAEIWTDPLGRPAKLIHVGLTVFDSDDEGDDCYWYPEGSGQRHPHTYRIEAVHNERLALTEVVFPVDPWSPYDAIADRLIGLGFTPPEPTAEELETCQHGLSARLCAGPGHYPDDEER